jgi:V/A-type H+-transporting ATPase subunit C
LVRLAIAGKATEALLHAGSGQIADFLLDAGALAAIDSSGKASPSALMRQYARITVDGANARIALRAARMRLQRDALEIAIPPAGSLDRKAIIAAALTGPEAVLQALETTEYSGAAAEGQKSAGALERWFDDYLMEKLRPQRRVYEGFDPIAAYLIGREREIDAVRLILAALTNHIAGDRAQERLRALYV